MYTVTDDGPLLVKVTLTVGMTKETSIEVDQDFIRQAVASPDPQ